MIKYLFVFFQLILILIIATWAINNSQPVTFAFNDLIISTSSSVLVILFISAIIIALIAQRLIFYIRQLALKIKFNRHKSSLNKGYESFLSGMLALANKDYKRAVSETKKINKYFTDESLSLLLKSEIFKIERKFDELNQVYEAMLKKKNMNSLGLRGLMEQNIRAQDFHHAYIYGEKLFYQNPSIDKLYETLLNIIGKTNNWQKLIEITDLAFKKNLINKEKYSENKSIGLFEMAKIKQHSSIDDSKELISKALKLRRYFPPYVALYIKLLINNNESIKAKKYLNKVWENFPHPDLKNEIELLAKSLKISFYELAKFITKGSPSVFESKILLSESLIENEKWEDAKKHLEPLLEHKPPKIVCLLMAKIEEGETNDPQRIDSWVNRSNFGKLNKIWICKISNISQPYWTAVSNGGYFNSLIWKYPINNLSNQFSEFEKNSIKYINS